MIFQRRLTPIEVARELRKNMTDEERILWNELRNKRLNGIKFLRQYPFIYDSAEVPVKFYVLDFYCHSKRVAIELDGGIHKNQVLDDLKRELDIKNFGIRVLRINNWELKDIESVKEKILEFTDSPRPPLFKNSKRG
jgi:very-short-patch-repair endonuclease